MRAPDTARAERWLAEAFAAGAAGCEEREAGGGVTKLLLYVPSARAGAVTAALRAAGAEPEAPEAVPEQDWSEAWREGLAAIEISPRLVVRPPFVEHAGAPGQQEVVIEPGQAFGTGGHESTHLALELLDAFIDQVPRAPRLLDVGTGSGVLAIAGVKLGARWAVGFDLDPLAGEAAHSNAAENGVADRVEFFTGGIGSLAPGRFDLVVANLLRREVEPILAEVAARIAPGGIGIFTGLLASDRSRMEAGLVACGLALAGRRTRNDAGGEEWLGLAARAPIV